MKRDKILAVGNEHIQVSIHSNNKNVCLHCNELITEDNDSTWEVFTGNAPGETQPECKDCHARVSKEDLKKHEAECTNDDCECKNRK